MTRRKAHFHLEQKKAVHPALLMTPDMTLEFNWKILEVSGPAKCHNITMGGRGRISAIQPNCLPLVSPSAFGVAWIPSNSASQAPGSDPHPAAGQRQGPTAQGIPGAACRAVGPLDRWTVGPSSPPLSAPRRRAWPHSGCASSSKD